MKLRPLDKKGIEISMNTLIITIIVVLVLLIVALSFTYGMRGLIDQIKRVFGVTTESPQALAKDRCANLCALQRTEAYCNGVDVLVTGNETRHFDCTVESPCPGIPCT
ncbi:MAG: hypothetical protein KJ767_03585 [Nanoarchaeota archaeon]|nr:hypothetical protein [Nanoarchaeota archaeon]